MGSSLMRSRLDRRIAGVCGGIAQQQGWDSTLIRILWVCLVLFGGTGILAYLVLWVVLPEEPYSLPPYAGYPPPQGYAAAPPQAYPGAQGSYPPHAAAYAPSAYPGAPTTPESPVPPGSQHGAQGDIR